MAVLLEHWEWPWGLPLPLRGTRVGDVAARIDCGNHILGLLAWMMCATWSWRAVETCHQLSVWVVFAVRSEVATTTRCNGLRGALKLGRCSSGEPASHGEDRDRKANWELETTQARAKSSQGSWRSESSEHRGWECK